MTKYCYRVDYKIYVRNVDPGGRQSRPSGVQETKPPLHHCDLEEDRPDKTISKKKNTRMNTVSGFKKKTNLNDRDKKVKLLQYICTRMCIAPPECRPNGDPLKKHRE